MVIDRLKKLFRLHVHEKVDFEDYQEYASMETDQVDYYAVCKTCDKVFESDRL